MPITNFKSMSCVFSESTLLLYPLTMNAYSSNRLSCRIKSVYWNCFKTRIKYINTEWNIHLEKLSWRAGVIIR